MRLITEIKKGKLSKYKIDEIIDSSIIFSRIIEFPISKITFEDREYWVLYNDNMEIIDEYFKYLNFRHENYSKNTLKTIAYQLRLLYIFADIFDINIQNMQFKDCIKLSNFLQGKSNKGENIELRLTTQRSRNTVLTMFGFYSMFLYYSGFNVNAINMLSPSSIVSSKSLGRGSKRLKISDPKNNYRDVPKFINTENFKEIIQYIRNSNSPYMIKTRNEIIIRLMYEGGMRIGEVLGLTLEDVLLEKDSKGREYGRIIITNRLSDKTYQHAKGCMDVKAKKDYQKNEYSKKGTGWEETYINIKTYDLLNEYIDMVHGKGNLKKNRIRYQKALTEAVGEYKKNNENNYYVFLNKYFSPLSSTTWNKELRIIFENVGLDIDYKVRNNNLSHRFRHGFAMHLLFDLHYPIEFVQKRMRHRSQTSTEIYINPTSEQIIEMKEEMEDEYLFKGEIL